MMRALFILAALALGVGAHAAQPDAPKPATSPPPESAPATRVPAAPLGRLFFSPTERAQLDVARVQKRPSATAAASEAVEAPPAPQVVTYGGLVRRSDGRQMLWLNNRLVDEKEALVGMSIKGKVRPDGSVTLQAQSGATVDLKVGQSVELYTGKIAETRKAPPESAKPSADDGKAASAEAKDASPESKSVAAKPAPPDTTEKKPPPGGMGLKMDLGGRALSAEEAARVSSSAK